VVVNEGGKEGGSHGIGEKAGWGVCCIGALHRVGAKGGHRGEFIKSYLCKGDGGKNSREGGHMEQEN